jgi:pentatricopeptide repeat protein
MSKLDDLEKRLNSIRARGSTVYSDPKCHWRKNFEFPVAFARARRTGEVVKWLNKMCQDDFSLDLTNVSFKNKQDAMLFKLTWVGV